MNRSIFQMPPKIACSTFMSKTVEPPTSASGPATAWILRTIARAGEDSAWAAIRASTSQCEPSLLRTGGETETTPGTAASRRGSPPGSRGVTTWTGELKPGPASAIARSVAARTSEPGGSSFRPRLNVCIASSGAASTSSTPAPAARNATGRRITAAAHVVQKALPLSSPVLHGRGSRSRSTRLPATARSAGSSVVAARTEMQTTTIAPIASERIPFTPIANSPASETATVAPLKTTALPEVESARESAASGDEPPCSSLRNRLTMKRE